MACRLVIIIWATGYFFGKWALAAACNLGFVASLDLDFFFFLLSSFGLNLLSLLNGFTTFAADAVCGLRIALAGSLVLRFSFSRWLLD